MPTGRKFRVYTTLGPELLALLKRPALAPLLGREVEITVRPVPTLEEVQEILSVIPGSLADDIIAERKGNG